MGDGEWRYNSFSSGIGLLNNPDVLKVLHQAPYFSMVSGGKAYDH
jgi:hypothetical protein